MLNVIVHGEAHTFVFASVMAWRSDPVPLSLVLVTSPGVAMTAAAEISEVPSLNAAPAQVPARFVAVVTTLSPLTTGADGMLTIWELSELALKHAEPRNETASPVAFDLKTSMRRLVVPAAPLESTVTATLSVPALRFALSITG